MPFEGVNGRESANATDYSGYGNNLTVLGARWNRTGGKIGGAYLFNGSGNVLECLDANCGGTNAGDLDMGTQDWTALAWVKTFTGGNVVTKSGFMCGGGNPDGWGFGVYENGHLSAGLHDQASADCKFTADDGTSVNDGNWHLIAGVFDRDGYLTRYADGQKTGADLDITSLTGDVIDDTKNFYIGMRDEAGDPGYFNGSIDEVRIFNFSLTRDQIYQIFLEENKSKNAQVMLFNETSLNDQWICSVTPNDGYFDGTTKNSTAVTISSTNTAPSITALSFSPPAAKTSSDIQCNATITDDLNSSINAEYWWYNNSVLALSGNKTVSNSTNTIITTLGSGNTTKGETWNCTIRAYDGVIYSSTNSTTIAIQNSAPLTVTLLSPANGNTTVWSNPPTFYWQNTTDADNDPLNYSLNLTSSSCPDYGVFNNISSLSFLPGNELQMSCVYFWQVLASDGTGNSSWSDRYNFTIEPAVILTLTTSSVDFDTLNINSMTDTDNNKSPIVVRNDGNLMANISISINQSIFSTYADNTEYFQFKADNDTTESGSFNWTASVTTWTNLTVISSMNESAISNLNYVDTKDDAEIDIKIAVPSNEPPGAREATLYVIGQQS